MAEKTEKDLQQAETPRIKGDPDFAGVARERVAGPADYDESGGNEIRTDTGAQPVETETDPGDEDR